MASQLCGRLVTLTGRRACNKKSCSCFFLSIEFLVDVEICYNWVLNSKFQKIGDIFKNHVIGS